MSAMHEQGGAEIADIEHIAQPYWFDNGGDLSPEEKARKQTTDAIKEVRRWGESVKLPPLTVEMRKVVLEVLEEYPDVIMEGDLDEHVDRKRVTLLLKD